MPGGPSRPELVFRLVFSLVGLVLVAGTVLALGEPRGLAMVEVIAIAGLFFGITVFWTVRKLRRRR